MTIDFAVEVLRRGVIMVLVVSGPLLLTSLIVGVLVSLLQAVTQIQEQTLTFVPKVLILGAVFLMILPWILTRLVEHFTMAMSTLGSGML